MKIPQFDKLTGKQAAKKGWVADLIKDCAAYSYNLATDVGSQMTMELEIFRQVLVTKFGITQEDLNNAEQVVIERNKKDLEIIHKYKDEKEMSNEDKIKAMQKDGLSSKAMSRAIMMLKNENKVA